MVDKVTALKEAVEQHFAVDENGLRRCDVCRNQAVMWEWLRKFHVECSSCDVCGITGDTIEEACSSWNTRASDPIIRELWRRLEVMEAMAENISKQAMMVMQNDYGSVCVELNAGDVFKAANEALTVITAPFEGGNRR